MEKHRFKAMACAAAFFAIFAPGPAALRADPADDFLVRVSVPDGRFVSFVDGDGWCAEAWKTNRLARWKARVAARVGVLAGRYPGPEDVRPQDWRKPFRVQIDPAFQGAAGFLREGDAGWEERAFDGGETVRTNRFSVRSVDLFSMECDVAWTPPGEADSFELDSAQGAGDGVWLLSWRDLEARWKNRLPAEGAAVRGEIWDLMSDARLQSGAPGAASWKRRLDRFLDTTKSVWPGIRFENASGEPVLVKLLAGDAEVEPARLLPSGGSWTAPVRELPKAGSPFNWMACPAGGGLCEKDYGTHPVGDWSHRSRSPAVVSIDNALKPLPDPVLVLDDRIFPRETLGGLSEETLRAFVRYADENGEKRLDVNWTEDRPTAAVAPHRPVEAVRFELSVPGLPENAELASARKGHYCCGETVALDGRVEWAPWPELVVRNPDGRLTVTNTIRFLGADGKPVRDALRVVVKPGETRKPDFGGSISGNVPSTPALTLRVVSEAVTCDPSVHEVPFARGGKTATVDFVPPRQDFRWPAKDQMRIPLASCQTWLGNMGSSKRAADDAKQIKNLRDNVFSETAAKTDADGKLTGAGIFSQVRTHLNACRGCEKCDGFRNRNAAWLLAPGEKTPDEGVFLALFHDDQIVGKRKTPAAAEESTEKARRKIGAENVALGYDAGGNAR